MDADDRREVEVSEELTALAAARAELDREVAAIEARHTAELRAPRARRRQVSDQIAQAIASQLGIDAFDVLLDHGPACENSPTGWCVYDGRNDPALDGCVFCHDPCERQ